MANELTKRVLEENALEDDFRMFRRSEEACRHIDRHVIDVAEARDHSWDVRSEACGAALALARSWSAVADGLRQGGVLLSRPLAIVDDDWLDGSPMATPPHVYVCMAKGTLSFQPGVSVLGSWRAKTGIEMLDLHLAPGDRLQRSEGEEGMPGSWTIDVDGEGLAPGELQ